MAKSQPELLSCGGVIFRRTSTGGIEYLIVQHASRSRHWSFPKGAVEQNETEQECAVREIEEEAGLPRSKLKIIHKLDREATYFLQRGPKSPQKPKRVKFFLTESTGGLVQISAELVDHKWLNFREAVYRLTHDQDRDVLKEAERKLRKLLDNVQ